MIARLVNQLNLGAAPEPYPEFGTAERDEFAQNQPLIKVGGQLER